MTDLLTPIITQVRQGKGRAIPSVCSAHADVIEAAMRLAADQGMPLLVEATSNQVNQFGGYTGMTPADFIAYVGEIAERVGFDRNRIIFGGDHLGPQAWRKEDAETAMAKARDMMRAYVEAGFTKIHLDCSEGCAGEPAQVGDALAAARAADLAKVCEDTQSLTGQPLLYIIGTEVPPPGGARAGEHGITPTPPENAAATLEAHRRAFDEAGVGAAFDRVRGLVVQPGLEFAPDHVYTLDLDAPDALSPVLGRDDLCFEAHSTDYQPDATYPDLARRNFAILKVGPALTFAWREAAYALSHIRHWLDGTPHLSEVMEKLMLAQPAQWQGHYRSDAAGEHILRHFGYADRIRYYWPQPEAVAAVNAMIAALDTAEAAGRLPAPVWSQYLSEETLARADALCAQSPGLRRARAVLLAHVQRALLPYYG